MANERQGTIETIVGLKNQEPFEPFVVVMRSGDRYTIEFPDGLAVGGSQLHYYPARTDIGIHMRISQITAQSSNSVISV